MSAAVTTSKTEAELSLQLGNVAEQASAQEITTEGDGNRHIALIDFGYKNQSPRLW